MLKQQSRVFNYNHMNYMNNYASIINKLKVILPLVIGLLVGALQLNAVHAAPVDDPAKLIEHITSSVMHELRANKDKLNSDNQIVYNMIDDLVLPYVDFVEMSKWIAGKSAWFAAPPATQNEFIKEFKVLLLRTYASALNKYTDETIEIYPLTSDSANQNRVQVLSRIKRSNQDNIRIDYRLVKDGSRWALYDVIIEGVSILKGFQAQFSDEIKRHGLQHVTAMINTHNNQEQQAANE